MENTTETLEKKISEDSSAAKKRGGTPKNDGPWKWLLVVLWGSSIVCIVIFALGKYKEYRAGQAYADLARQTVLEVSEKTPRTILEEIAEPLESESQQTVSDSMPEPEPDPMQVLQDLGVPVPENKAVDFVSLQEETNADIYAWIYIPNTNIDYPVLQHPTDNSFYLLHNLDGSSGYPGCIYTENYNSKDWTDPVTLLYGHTMNSTGTMFNQLHKFEDEEFFDENQYILIYTPEKLLAYQIFAAEVHSDEHILLNHDFSDPESFQKFFSEVQDTSGSEKLVREGVELSEDSKIIALSTCMKDNNRPSNRWLVYGVLLNE